MAGQTPPLSPALHPHLGFLAQSSRALLRPDHSAAHPARCLHLGRRTRNRHSRLPRTPQCTPQALHLDQICRRNPRKGHPRAKRPRTSPCREPTVKSTTLAFPIWSYLSCYPARFMASPPFLRHLCRAAHKRALFDYLNAITTCRFAEQRSKLGNMDCERRLNIPHSAVIPPSTNSRAPVT